MNSHDHTGSNGQARRRPVLFRALGRKDLPETVRVAGADYRLHETLKHDSWAATGVYRGEAGIILCKFNRREALLGFPLEWLGRYLARREAGFLERLADLGNTPRPLGPVEADGQVHPNAVARPFIPGHPLGAAEQVDDRFFPALRATLGHMHARGIAYMDLHKRENVLVGDDGLPHLIDFQVCVSLPPWCLQALPPLRGLLRSLQHLDAYHLRKHVAKLRPDQWAEQDDGKGLNPPWWLQLHRWVATPFRRLRRGLLVRLRVRSGIGHATTEAEPEDAVRRELAAEARRAAA